MVEPCSRWRNGFSRIATHGFTRRDDQRESVGSKTAHDPSLLSPYTDAQIHSHVPRRNPGDWALEISGSILVSEKTKARFGSRPETEIGTLRAFLIPPQEARQE